MKYLRNLPLGLAALAQVCFDLLVLLGEPLPGWSHEEMRSLMLAAALAAWLPLLVAAVGAVFTKVPRGPRRVRMLAATGVIAVTLGASMVIALSGSAAVAGEKSGFLRSLEVLLLVLPTSGGTLVPLMLIAWLCWLINAPLPAAPAATARRVIVAAALLTLPGGILGTVSLGAFMIRAATPQPESERVSDQRYEASQAAQFASLTDASPLHSWAEYALSKSPGDQKERRPAALRRLALRPTLEADIATDLVGSVRDDSNMAFLLVERVQFAPSAALGAPLRRTIARIVAEIRSEGHPGYSSDPEGRYGDPLAASLVIAIKMANAGVDLRGALGDLQRAAVEVYLNAPGSDDIRYGWRMAQTYPGNVAAADRKIEAILSARKTN